MRTAKPNSDKSNRAGWVRLKETRIGRDKHERKRYEDRTRIAFDLNSVRGFCKFFLRYT